MRGMRAFFEGRPVKAGLALMVLQGLLWVGLSPVALAAQKASESDPLKDYPEVKLSHPISRTLQGMTGMTLMTRLVAASVATKVLRKELGGDLKLSIRPYSSGDLVAGKVHGLKLSGKNLLVDGALPVTRLEAVTNEDSNVYVLRRKKPMLLHPVKASLTAEITEADLQRFLASEKAQKLLQEIDVPLPPFSRQKLDALSPEVHFEEGRVRVGTRVNVHGAPEENAVPVQAVGQLWVDKGNRLKLRDVALSVEGLEETRHLERLAELYFDDLMADLLSMNVDGHNVKIRVSQVDIVDDTLHLRAVVEAKPGKDLLRKLAAESAR